MTAADADDVATRALPDELADRFRIVLGLEEPPATVGDWAAAVSRSLADAGVSIGPADLCTTGESRHEARVDGEVVHLRCVLDALLVPFVYDEPGPVEVRSRSPVSDVEVAATVDAAPEAGALSVADDRETAGRIREVTVEPAGAVASLGVVADAPPADDLDGSPLQAYELFCPYVNAFADREEYQTWAEGTPDAETTALPLEAAFEVARLLATRPPALAEDGGAAAGRD